MNRLLLSALLLAVPGISACASTPVVRDLAVQTRTIADRYVGETRGFAERQDQLRAQANARLAIVGERGVIFRRDTERARQAWLMDADRRAESLYAVGAANDAAELQQDMIAATPSSSPTPASPPDLTKALEALAELARGPSEQERLQQGIAFMRAVAAETDELRKKSDAAAAAAAAHGQGNAVPPQS